METGAFRDQRDRDLRGRNTTGARRISRPSAGRADESRTSGAAGAGFACGQFPGEGRRLASSVLRSGRSGAADQRDENPKRNAATPSTTCRGIRRPANRLDADSRETADRIPGTRSRIKPRLRIKRSRTRIQERGIVVRELKLEVLRKRELAILGKKVHRSSVNHPQPRIDGGITAYTHSSADCDLVSVR